MAHQMMFAEDYLDFDPAEAEAEVSSALPQPEPLQWYISINGTPLATHLGFDDAFKWRGFLINKFRLPGETVRVHRVTQTL